MIWDHPAQKFVIQADTVGTPAQTDVGLNYDILATAGNSTYKQSRQEMDVSTSGTSSVLALRLVGFDRAQGNAAGVNVDCIVVVNLHQLDSGIEGA